MAQQSQTQTENRSQKSAEETLALFFNKTRQILSLWNLSFTAGVCNQVKTVAPPSSAAEGAGSSRRQWYGATLVL